MEFDVKIKKKKKRKKNLFEFRITFMENDADDFKTKVISIPSKKLENKYYKKQLEHFIKHVFDCVEMDSKGRGGLETPLQLYKHYGKVDGWNRYNSDIYDAMDYDNTLKEMMEDDGIDKNNYFENLGYGITMDTYGNCYDSYYKAEMFYFDSDGDEYPVTIKF